MPHPGVGPTTDPNLIQVLPNGGKKKNSTKNFVKSSLNFQYFVIPDEVRHGWYQWVCFVLVGQAFLFYLPHFLWKSWEGNYFITYISLVYLER